jgi:hypothetical protein
MTAVRAKPIGGRPCRCPHRSEVGSATVLGVGMIIVMLFVGGVSYDLWRVFGERRVLAETADAAAAAGANGIDVDGYRQDGLLLLDPRLAEILAAESLLAQSDVGSLTAFTIEASTEVVVVEVSGRVDITLLDLFTRGEPFVIKVRAEAAPRRGLS